MEQPILLVVENEAVIRMNIVQVAQDSGFAVLEAGDADEAIELLENHSDIRVIFTAVRMPGSMDGLKLANVVKGRWPSVQLLVTSGLDVSTHPDFPVHGRLIRKPYENGQITAVLREILDVK